MSNKSNIFTRLVSLSVLFIKTNCCYYLLLVYHKTMQKCSVAAVNMYITRVAGVFEQCLERI